MTMVLLEVSGCPLVRTDGLVVGDPTGQVELETLRGPRGTLRGLADEGRSTGVRPGSRRRGKSADGPTRVRGRCVHRSLHRANFTRSFRGRGLFVDRGT